MRLLEIKGTFIGTFFLFLAWLFSINRKAINWNLVGKGIALQIIIALLVLKIPFVENIFDKHVDWMSLLTHNDNYKNILQVKLQKAFQVTPIYREMDEWNEDDGYSMGVFLCIGYNYHNIDIHSYKNIDDLEKINVNSSIIDNIQNYFLNISI